MDVQYFDQNNGTSRFRILVDDQLVDEWSAGDALPSARISGETSTRREIHGFALRPDDEIRIEGFPDRGEHAAIDYFELHPEQSHVGTAVTNQAPGVC